MMESTQIQLIPQLATPSIEICCPNCGGSAGKLGEGKGPHAAKIVCSSCDRFIKWLSKSALSDLLQSQGGSK